MHSNHDLENPEICSYDVRIFFVLDKQFAILHANNNKNISIETWTLLE